LGILWVASPENNEGITSSDKDLPGCSTKDFSIEKSGFIPVCQPATG
jgi:hypothetical protein